MSAIILCKIRGLSHDILTSAAKIVEKKKTTTKNPTKTIWSEQKGQKEKKTIALLCYTCRHNN